RVSTLGLVQMPWLLLLMLAPLAHAALRWGDPSCWRGWQNHQLCCYPQVRNVQELRVEEGFDACWTEGRNVSRCCRRSGAFFIAGPVDCPVSGGVAELIGVLWAGDHQPPSVNACLWTNKQVMPAP
ncbi:unnamed protein product, partial [Effrenium voratum]